MVFKISESPLTLQIILYKPLSHLLHPSHSSRLDWRPYLWLGVIITVALGLRLYRLDYQSLWLDELYSMNPAAPGTPLPSLIDYCKKDQPPGYFLLLWAWFKVLPYTDFFGRLLSALIGTLGVLATYFLAKEVCNAWVGLFASVMAALNFYQLYFSQEVRFYCLLYLFSALSYLFFLRSVKNPRWTNFAVYSLCSIGLAYTHYFGPIVIIAQALTFLVLVSTGKRDPRFLWSGAVSGLVIFIGYLPWLPTILSDLGLNSYWPDQPGPWFFLEHVQAYFNYSPYTTTLVALLTTVFVVKLILWVARPSHRKAWEAALALPFLVLMLWIVVGYGLPYAYSIWRTPILVPRYTTIVLPALFTVCALGWWFLPGKVTRGVVVLVALFFLGRTIFFKNDYYTKITKSQFRQVSRTVVQQNVAGAPIYSDLDWFYNYYLRQFHSPVMAINPHHLNFEANLAGHQEVWLLKAQLGYRPEATAQLLQTLEKEFRLQKRVDFHDAYALQFVRKQPKRQ